MVATQEARNAVLGKVAFVILDQVTGNRRFPPLEMRQQAVLHKLRALHFDVAVGRAGQVLDHVRRHAERAANLNHLVLPRLKELGGLVAAAQLVGLHAIRQDRRAECPVAAAVHPLPLLAQTLCCFNRDRVVGFKHHARPGIVPEERTSVLLERLGQPDSVGKQLVGRDRRDAVFGCEPQGKNLVMVVDRVAVAVGFPVLVPQRPVLKPLDFHAT